MGFTLSRLCVSSSSQPRSSFTYPLSFHAKSEHGSEPWNVTEFFFALKELNNHLEFFAMLVGTLSGILGY